MVSLRQNMSELFFHWIFFFLLYWKSPPLSLSTLFLSLFPSLYEYVCVELGVWSANFLLELLIKEQIKIVY